MTSSRRDWTAREVVSLLLDLARQLQELDASLGDLEQDYVKKAEAHNNTHTKAFLLERAKDSPQYVCKAVADQASSGEHLDMALAQAMVRGQKRKIEILRERIGVGRTAAASLRASSAARRAHRAGQRTRS